MNNKNNWKRELINECACGCDRMVAKKYAKGHGSRKPLADRFNEKLDKSGDCWIWTGAASLGGYGRIGHERRTHQAHRVAYELDNGPIPDGLHVDHLCGNRLCCNPDHLEAVTQGENNRRANTTRWAAATHCKRGQLMAGDNLATYSCGARACRTCRNMMARRRRQRIKTNNEI